MDAKLSFCVFVFLILLVTYGAEARKMVEGNPQLLKENSQFVFNYKQGAEDNHQEVLKEDSGFVFNYKQGAEDNRQQVVKENSQFVFIYKQEAEDNHQQVLKEDSPFVFNYKHGAEDNHQQVVKDDSRFVFNYKHGAEDNHQQVVKDDSQFVFNYKQGAKDNRQVKDNSQFVFNYKQGAEDNHQVNKNSPFVFNYKQGAEDNRQVNKNSPFVFNYKQGAEDNHQQVSKKNEHMHSSSHMDHMDPSLGVFFLMDDLKLGKTITVSFPASSPQIFPKKAADSIPFSFKELPNLLQHFSFSKDSPQAKAMEESLRICEDSPTKGEKKYCATSVEAMHDFVQRILGEKTQIEPLITMKTQSGEYSITPLNHHLQNYTILNDPQDVGTPKMVACHTMPSAYTVYYCHYTIGKSKVFKVSLRNDANGDKVEAIAVCHLDTSKWSPSHVSLRVLGILPGTSPVCHFFPSYSLVWVPKTIATTRHDEASL